MNDEAKKRVEDIKAKRELESPSYGLDVEQMQRLGEEDDAKFMHNLLRPLTDEEKFIPPPIKTSKLFIRPFVCTREEFGGEPLPEPFALLAYGGVTIQLDYTIFNRLRLDIENQDRTVSMFNFGRDEIYKEMAANIEGSLHESTWFRDNPSKCSMTHAWSPFHLYSGKGREKHVVWEKEEKKGGGE